MSLTNQSDTNLRRTKEKLLYALAATRSAARTANDCLDYWGFVRSEILARLHHNQERLAVARQAYKLAKVKTENNCANNRFDHSP